MVEFLPLIKKLGEYLKVGVDHYADLRAAGSVVDVDIISMYLDDKMSGWNPVLSGKNLLDAPTRAAAARFLAGVAVNFARK
jgi:hypothetical protein